MNAIIIQLNQFYQFEFIVLSYQKFKPDKKNYGEETAMYVCICNAISDRQIQETVAAGATSLGDLKDQLGVATCCGCCAELASSYLGNQHANATQMVSPIVVEH